MAKRDYYEVLGLKRDSNEAQIKAAYRKAARKFHPDVNKAPDAADRFKEATEAYEVLSDKQKRQMYDQFGFAGRPEAFGGGARPGGRGAAYGPGGVSFNFEDLFGGRGGSFMGMSLDEILGALGGGGRVRGRRPGGPRGYAEQAYAENAVASDIEHPLDLDFLDAIRGTTANLRLSGGGGRSETLSVKIPPGVCDGQRIRLRGKGQGGGDLYIVVHPREHPYFRREGNDIYVDCPISVAEAVLGASVEVPTLEGPTQLKVPPGSGSRTLRLRGAGVRSADGQQRGDQYVVLKVTAPVSVSEQGARLLRQFTELEKLDPRKDVPWKR